MSINALSSCGPAYAPAVTVIPAKSQSGSTGDAISSAGTSADGLTSTEVTLTSSAVLNFYSIPSSLGLQSAQQNNPWRASSAQNGNSTQPGASVFGTFAENELASHLSSPSALNGATVTVNNFSLQSDTSSGGTEHISSGSTGQGLSQSNSEAADSFTVQGSGEITLADGEVMSFDATFSTTASAFQSSTMRTGGVANSSSDSTTTPTTLNVPDQSSTVQSASGTPTSNAPGADSSSTWNSMMQQYSVLLTLFEAAKVPVQHAPASHATAADASSTGSSSPGQGATTNATINVESITATTQIGTLISSSGSAQN